MIRPLTRMVAVVFIAAGWTLCAPLPASAQAEATAAPAPRPAIWLLADEDTRIYLFGTVHVLRQGLEWRSQAVNRMIDESDELVMEISFDALGEAARLGIASMQLGKSVPLVERVAPSRREALRRMLASAGLAAESLDGLKTWAAAMALAGATMGRTDGAAGKGGPPDAGVSGPGVEDALTQEFERLRRPISGVETPEAHARVFRGLPEHVQRQMLEQSIDQFTSGESGSSPGETDWLVGDDVALAEAMEALPPDLYEALLTVRNRAWTDWLVARLEDPGTVLFAVGAGHLAGPDSVQSMLAEKGFQVRRID